MRSVAEFPLDTFGSEAELAQRVLDRLAPWFLIETEVRGTHCSGRNLRIDAVLRPRDAQTTWRNPDVAFGVEFKLPRRGAGLNAYAGWIAQAVSYTHVDWQGYGRRIILTCPGAASWLDRFGNDEHRRDLLIAKRLTGQLGIGELVLRWGHGLSILVNGERVWSERSGVSKGKYWSLEPRSGSR
ncbi:hypothetical protein GCM10009789_36660 [Kribbella sancticallisti]|uniref:Uncharacterized protein n=1 Tax=Kribbella sancticallisti TaxID=460087 RepID=A0ABN2DKZ6_9ACTN